MAHSTRYLSPRWGHHVWPRSRARAKDDMLLRKFIDREECIFYWCVIRVPAHTAPSEEWRTLFPFPSNRPSKYISHIQNMFMTPDGLLHTAAMSPAERRAWPAVFGAKSTPADAIDFFESIRAHERMHHYWHGFAGNRLPSEVIQRIKELCDRRGSLRINKLSEEELKGWRGFFSEGARPKDAIEYVEAHFMPIERLVNQYRAQQNV